MGIGALKQNCVKQTGVIQGLGCTEILSAPPQEWSKVDGPTGSIDPHGLAMNLRVSSFLGHPIHFRVGRKG